MQFQRPVRFPFQQAQIQQSFQGVIAVAPVVQLGALQQQRAGYRLAGGQVRGIGQQPLRQGVNAIASQLVRAHINRRVQRQGVVGGAAVAAPPAHRIMAQGVLAQRLQVRLGAFAVPIFAQIVTG